MTLLIKNGLIIDGTGSEPFHADVFVSGERISAIGNFSGKRADHVIDAQGMQVAPGFIDAHSEADHRLEILRGEEGTYLREGITTAIGGHEGVSLAPLLYGDLSLCEWWTHLRHANVDWHTMGEFRNALAKRKLACNFATFAGYETVAQAITGGSARELVKNESRAARTLVSRSMREGALGVSFGSASRTMKIAGGIAEIPADSESGASWLAQEAFRHANGGHTRAVISGVVPRMRREDGEKLISAIEKGSGVRVSVSPTSAFPMPLFSLLPEEAREGGRYAACERLRDDAFRAGIEKSFPEIDPKTARIEHEAGRAPFPPVLSKEPDILWGGTSERTLKEYMKWHGIRDYRKGITRLMEMSELHAVLAVPQDGACVARALASPVSLVGSYGSHGAFSEYLSRIGADSALLRQAIKKITSDAAEFFGIRERGTLKEKYFADIVGIKDGVAQFTVVNGQVAMREGEHGGAKAGKFL